MLMNKKNIFEYLNQIVDEKKKNEKYNNFMEQSFEKCLKDLNEHETQFLKNCVLNKNGDDIKTPEDFQSYSVTESENWEQLMYLIENNPQEIALISRSLVFLYLGYKMYKNHPYYFKTIKNLPKNLDNYLYVGNYATISTKLIIVMWWLPALWFLGQDGNLEHIMANILNIDIKYALIFVWFPFTIGAYEFLSGTYLVEALNIKPPNNISTSDKWFNRAKFVVAWLVIWRVEWYILIL